MNLKQPLSDVEVATIRSALLKWKVVFFRDQDTTPAEQAPFARRFRQPTPAHSLERGGLRLVGDRVGPDSRT